MPIADLDTDQRRAASATGAEIAVSAGAGSGKTRLLVARYLRLIHQDKVPMDAIAAITFTNKAANQMKARIAQRAGELADTDHPNRESWLKVARNAHRARVSTIHAFCSLILRRFPVEADVDPTFTVIDTVTDTELRRKVVDELIAQRLSEGGDDTAFLLAVFGLPGLSGMLHELLGMRTQVVRFIDEAGHDGSLGEGTFAVRYERYLRGELDGLITRLEDFHALKPGDDALTPVYDNVLAAFIDARKAIGNGDTVDCDALSAASRSIMLNRGSSAKWGKETLADLKAALRICRTFLDSLETYYRLDRSIAPRAAALLMHDYLEAEELHRQRKRERGMLDNDDLLIETWRLLRTRYDICRRVSGMFRHILVDEFQDTDGLQMDILNMIAGNSAASLFTVGDPKQSIYRFRGADVTVFNNFIMGNHTTFVPLTTNYRSAPAVMAFVNEVFGRLMGDEPAHQYEAVYRSMKTNRRDSPFSPAVDITVVAGTSGEERRRREALLIVNRIAELAGINNDYSSMAILLRTGAPLRVFEEVLLACGIPFVNRVGGKLAGSTEAYDIGNLLGWLDNPDDPALLVAVLASPFFGLGADALYTLRFSADSAETMPGMLCRLADETPENPELGELVPAARILTRLAAVADRMPVREVLERAFDETGYTLTLLADPVEGDRSLATVDLIVETAARYEREGGTKREFSRLLCSGMPFTDETAQVETTGNTVSIMTIHGAKGLEFDVVFLADVTGAGSRSSGLVFDDDLGPGFVIRDDRGGTRETIARRCILEIEKQKEDAESKRLLYVACTRAKNRLFISGGPPAKSGDNGSGNWMTWLHQVLDLPRDGSADRVTNNLFRYTWDEESEPVSKPGAVEQALAICSAYDNPINDILDDSMDVHTAISTLTSPVIGIPVKSISETISVSKLLDLIDLAQSYERNDIVVSPERNCQSADLHNKGVIYGDLFHKVLERIAFDKPESWNETARIVVDGLPETAPFLGTLIDDLSRFALSPLVQILAGDASIHREEPFMIMIGEVLVRGTIDLIYDTGGDTVIVDYKTGAIPGDNDPLMYRYRLQLAIYALAVWHATDQMPKSLTLAFVSTDDYQTFTCTRELLDETMQTLSQALGV